MQNTQSSKKKVSTMCSVDLICTCAAEILLMHQVFCCHCKVVSLTCREQPLWGIEGQSLLRCEPLLDTEIQP